MSPTDGRERPPGGGAMAILKLEGLVHGHYECRSLDETLPVFTDLLAA
ncbi:MAG: hypothetical protein IH891_09600, partial [Planctomycetes bacterium]|nr:hypothetical protein [Planctomycetota bacterium]